MRIAVIGAGAVGGTLAALLAGSGHEVEVTARGSHLAAIRMHGIRLRGAFGDLDAAVTASETLTVVPDLAIVATKAQDADEAIGANAGRLRGIPVLVVQNGLDGVSGAQRLLPESPVVGGLAMFAASYLVPGEITVTAAGSVYLGGSDRHVAERVASMVSPPLETHIVDNFAGAQWTKLVVNMINALPAITGQSAQEVIGNPAHRRIMTLSMREAVRVGLARGVRFEKVSGLSHGLLRLFAVAPLWLADALPRELARRMGPVPNPGSTLQSIKRGQRSEIDYLNGAVVRAAAAVGLDAPVNARLVGLVHEVERTGKHVLPSFSDEAFSAE
jgi:2-dehydropantoate 2-reductase